ncbi:MAG: amino acid adenylation domain-containing protein [Ardenticatenales bacterium]|nr:amino acid adenylation domain-containing protein [Ardenticatenales bacterium]
MKEFEPMTHRSDLTSVCLDGLVEHYARSTPATTAIKFKQEAITYEVLNRQVNQFAHTLHQQGVRPGMPVGLAMEISVELIVALLAILRSGAAYVPLDPQYPRERLAFLMEDAQMSFLVTQGSLAEQLPQSKVQIIPYSLLDTRLPNSFSPPSRVPEQIAYIIYTSGSTGKPKGVCCHHKGILNLVEAFEKCCPLPAGSRFSLWTSISFDVSVYEIFSAFFVGGTLHLVPEPLRGEPEVLWAWLEEEQIESGYLPPFFLEGLADWLATRASQLHLKRLLVGVEPIPEAILVKIKSLVPALTLLNGYGPTEVAVCSTLYSVPPTLTAERRTPIGKAIQNLDLHILDEGGHPVPPGEVGELYIGGVGLAYGYWQSPSTTSERFIPDPFSQLPGRRLYRTGDLVSHLPDGNLVFVGRTDFQVKVRGYRIELGEIERAIQQHAAVQQAVVVVREDSPDHRWLVAYYAVKSREEVAPETLKAFVSRTLPAYMVPGAFMLLEAWPRTPSGKIDQKNLPSPAQRREPAASYPYTPTEKALAALWGALLAVPDPAPSDDFFTLGGHSLLATQLAARVRDVMQVELSPRDIFTHPTLAALAALINQERQNGPAKGMPPPSRLASDRIFPLSASQEQLWILQKLSPTSRAYQFQSLITFTGKLELALLQSALDEIIRRHEIFRTTFVEQDGIAVQMLHEPFPAQLTTVDMTGLETSVQQEVLGHQIEDHMGQLFQLDRLPLVRWALFQLADDRAVLFHIEHHIVHDGWSWNIFLRELLELYRVYSDKTYPLPPEPGLQFVDYAVWQQAWLKTEQAQKQLDYWLAQLADSPRLLQIPTDRPRPKAQTFQGTHRRFDIPVPLFEALRQMSQMHGVTPFITMLTAFKILLHRYSQQRDILVGSSIANRRFSEMEHAIGMYVNMLVLRTRLAPSESAAELLYKVKTTLLEAHAHQDYPFEKIVGALNPERTLDYNPLFQYAFHFHSAPLPPVAIPGLSYVVQELLANGSAKFDMNIVVVARPEQRVGFSSATASQEPMTVVWEYNTDIFDQGTVERMIQHYQQILETIVKEPTIPVYAIELHSEQEKAFILTKSTGNNPQIPLLSCIHLFEKQVQQSPSAVAITANEQRWTYGELNNHANQLARFLRERGMRQGAYVGVLADRSYAMIVAILAILKAGGAYVPLDTNYPTQRLQLMVEDARLDLLLTEKQPLPCPIPSYVQQIDLDTGWAEIMDRKPGPLLSLPDLQDTAYVLYTSGSTGTPKGVIMPHRPLANLLQWQATQFARTEGVRVLQFASLSFDVSFQEIFSTLTTGGNLHLIRADVQRDMVALLHRMIQEEIERLFVPYIVLQNLAAAASTLDLWPTSLQAVITAGEQFVLTPQIREFFGRLPSCELVNQYGPTETHVATAYTMGQPREAWPTLPPIGRPIDNAQVYLLDSHLAFVPIGVVGELYIGGDLVAEGYLNQAELTREKFMENPFDLTLGARLYRTGDLAYMLPDGNFVFLGRSDTQVKIRGHRVELGEIEVALHRHPGVREAAVTLHKDELGNSTLVAYLTLQVAGHADIQQLKNMLRESLPEYLIPTQFVTLSDLPRTASSKIDRARLPAPSFTHRSTTYVAPTNHVETIVAEVWEEVLGMERVGIHDNFFSIGGYSLLAAQVIARLSTRLATQLTLKDLFEAPTIAELAALIANPSLAREQPAPAITMDEASHLLRRIDELSQAEIEELLTRLKQDGV